MAGDTEFEKKPETHPKSLSAEPENRAGADPLSSDTVGRLGEGDEDAAARIVDCYVDRLIRLARSRMSPKLARRLDPEAIVQSALRTFFRHAQAGDYQLRQNHDVWRLLVAITINKVRRSAEHHRARRRSLDAEQSGGPVDITRWLGEPVKSREPSPEEATAFVEEIEILLRELSPRYRESVLSQAAGSSVEQTAEQLGCAERTVHRALESAERSLRKRLASWSGC